MSSPESDPSTAALLNGVALHPTRLSWLPDGSAVLSRHARRFAARIDLDGPSGPTAVYVKWFAAPRWRDLLAGRGWRSPAAAEARAAERLAEAGVRAPRVLEVRRQGGLVVPGESRLVLDAVPGQTLLESWPEAGAERRATARALGEVVAAMRRAGLGHPDLHCGHVLVDGGGGAPRVGVVDVARVGSAGDVVETLTALAASCPEAVSRTDRWRVVRGALEAAAGDATVRATVRAVMHGVPAMGARLRGRAVAAIHPEIEMDGGRMRADEGAVEMMLAYAYETCSAFREPGRGQVIRERGGYQNVRYHLRGMGPEQYWFGKRYYELPWAVRWRAWLGLAPRGDPALREWTMLRRCRALGIPVAAPVAVGLPGARGEASFVVTAEVSGARPLDDILRATPSRNREMRSGYHHALLELVRAFHGAGLTHRDLYLNHLLGGITPAGASLTLIDLARVERDAPFARHRLVKDLAALEYSAAPLTTRTERLRWYRDYRAVARLTDDDKQLARECVAKAAKIAEHERHVAERPPA